MVDSNTNFPFTKKSSGNSNIFIKNRFNLLCQEDSHANVIAEENIGNEKSNKINEHQTPFTIKSGTGNTRWPNVCTTEKHIQNYTSHIIPGNNSYSGTVTSGRKIKVVSDSRIKRIWREYSNGLSKGKAYFKSFSGANKNQMQN